jgi:hypothetical protein
MTTKTDASSRTSHSRIRSYSVFGVKEQYRCETCKRVLEREEIFNEPFTCCPDRYTRCCMQDGKFTGVIVKEMS